MNDLNILNNEMPSRKFFLGECLIKDIFNFNRSANSANMDRVYTLTGITVRIHENYYHDHLEPIVQSFDANSLYIWYFWLRTQLFSCANLLFMHSYTNMNLSEMLTFNIPPLHPKPELNMRNKCSVVCPT